MAQQQELEQIVTSVAQGLQQDAAGTIMKLAQAEQSQPGVSKQILSVIEQAQPGTVKKVYTTLASSKDQKSQQAAQVLGQMINGGQQAQAAKMGAKLQYIKRLQGITEEDEKISYFQIGGKVYSKITKIPVNKKGGCVKKCQDGESVSKKKITFGKGGCAKKCEMGGKPTKNVSIKAASKMKVNPMDTVHVNGNVYATTNSDGSRNDKRFPAYTREMVKKDKKTKDGQKRVEKQEMVSGDKKGGKLKSKK